MAKIVYARFNEYFYAYSCEFFAWVISSCVPGAVQSV